MSREEIEKFIEKVEAMQSYVFYRDMYLTIEKAKAVLLRGEA